MDTNKEKILNKHCHTEYHPETGELMVRSSEAAVMIAMDEYAQQVSRERTFEFLRRFSGINPDEPVVNKAYDEYFNKEDK